MESPQGIEPTFVLKDEINDMKALGELIQTVQKANVFRALTVAAQKTTDVMETLHQTGRPHYVGVSYKDKAQRRAKSKNSRKSRRKARG